MKRFAFVALILLVFISCSDGTENSSEEKGNNIPDTDSLQAIISDDSEEPDGELDDGESTPAQTDSRIEKAIKNLTNEQLYFSMGAGISVSVYDGKNSINAVAGYRDLESSTLLKAENTINVASITKLYTATVVMKLIEEGQISLEDKMSRWYPDALKADEVTLKMLLNHTAAMPREELVPEMKNNKTVFSSVQEVAETFLAIKAPYVTNPGTRFSYSNMHYAILAAICEKVTHKSYRDLIREIILDPLELKQTYFALEERPDDVTGHVFYEGEFYSYPIEDYVYAQKMASGDIFASSGDVARFVYALFNGEILEEESVEMMVDFPSGEAEAADYGLGVMKSVIKQILSWGHGGNMLVFNSWVTYFPDEKIAVMVNQNASVNYGEFSNLNYRIYEVYKDKIDYPEHREAEESFFENDSEHFVTFRISGYLDEFTGTIQNMLLPTAYFDLKGVDGYAATYSGQMIEEIFLKEVDGTESVVILANIGDESYLAETNGAERLIRKVVFPIPVEELIQTVENGENEISVSDKGFGIVKIFVDNQTGKRIRECVEMVTDPEKDSRIKFFADSFEMDEIVSFFGNIHLKESEEECE